MLYNYGLISSIDAGVIEKTLDLICEKFTEGVINVLEVGVYAGDTGMGITNYLCRKNRDCFLTGVDNMRDGEKIRTNYDKLIIGNSNEVYNQIEPESQDFVFIDGCHTYPMVISDFYCYSPKVKKGGFILFHDTGVHINPLHGYQGVGDPNDPDMCLGGVRKALNYIGLFKQWGGGSMGGGDWVDHTGTMGFELRFDESDKNDEAGGVCCYQKIY